MHRQLSDQNAFTLIEVIVSLVLLGILATIVGIGLVQVTKGYVFSKENSASAQKVQIAMTRIVKELGAATVITAATEHSVSYARAGMSTATIMLTGNLVQISGTYLPATNLPATTLLDKVTDLTLTYFDAAGAAPATTAEIRRIDITLTVTGASGVSSTVNNRVNILESYW